MNNSGEKFQTNRPTDFLTQIISRRQKNADANVASSISRRQNGIHIGNFQKIVFFQIFKRCCKQITSIQKLV